MGMVLLLQSQRHILENGVHLYSRHHRNNGHWIWNPVSCGDLEFQPSIFPTSITTDAATTPATTVPSMATCAAILHLRRPSSGVCSKGRADMAVKD